MLTNSLILSSVQFSEFDQVMRTDPESLKNLVLKVQRWLVTKQWRKVIYGAITVQKCNDTIDTLPGVHCVIVALCAFLSVLSSVLPSVARKIRYRQENAVVVQSVIRMSLAMKKHRPRSVVVSNMRHHPWE